MARGHIAELVLGGKSFNASSSSRALYARRTAACAACLLAACVAAVALARSPVESKTALSDINTFETAPAFNAEWDQKELQHHLVATQRAMTTSDNQIAKGISKLDVGVEELMRLIRHRPAGAGGVAGAEGEPGTKGETGVKGQHGPAGADGMPGAQGSAGRDGVPGTPGKPGEAGASGEAGRPGNFGTAGAMGKAGPAGVAGQRGQVGRTGRHGWEGPPGQEGVPAYLHAVHHYPYEDTDTSGAEGAARGSSEDKQTSRTSALRSGRSTQRKQHSLLSSRRHHQGGGSAEDAYKRTLRLGWKKEGDLSVAQVRISDDKGYEVHVAGPRGDTLRASLRGQDGFSKSWTGTSSLVSGAIAAGAPGSADFLKVTDRSSDETQYFRLPANK